LKRLSLSVLSPAVDCLQCQQSTDRVATIRSTIQNARRRLRHAFGYAASSTDEKPSNVGSFASIVVAAVDGDGAEFHACKDRGLVIGRCGRAMEMMISSQSVSHMLEHFIMYDGDLSASRDFDAELSSACTSRNNATRQ
jgi:hypothetical protein